MASVVLAVPVGEGVEVHGVRERVSVVAVEQFPRAVRDGVEVSV